MIFRTMLHALLSRFGPRLQHWDVARTRFRVLPTDLDILKHMNNGVYLSIMDIARLDLLHRTGIWPIFTARGWYTVVVSETISFRKSLTVGQRFTVESRILGFDEKAVYVEQRFVRPDADGNPEILALGFIRGRFLKRSGGVVGIEEGDQRRFRRADAFVAGDIAAAVLVEPDEADALVAERFRHLRAAVGRAVVDHDQFELTKLLVEHALDRTRKDVGAVMHRQDDRDFRRHCTAAAAGARVLDEARCCSHQQLNIAIA